MFALSGRKERGALAINVRKLWNKPLPHNLVGFLGGLDSRITDTSAWFPGPSSSSVTDSQFEVPENCQTISGPKIQ